MRIIKILAIFIISINQSVQSNESNRIDISNEFIRNANSYDSDGLMNMFDSSEFSEVVAKKIRTESDAKAFSKGVNNGAKKLFDIMMREAKAGSATFKLVGYSNYEKATGPMIRLTYETGGVDYYVLSLSRNNDKFADIYIATSGKLLSEQLAQVMGLLQREKSFLKRLLNIPNTGENNYQIIKKVGDLRLKGDHDGAYVELKKLPKKAQESKEMVELAVALAGSINDDLYQKELANLERLFGEDPMVAFALLDYYYLKEDYDNAIRSINTFEGFFGGDGQTNILKSNIYLASNSKKLAEKHAKLCSVVEPDLEDCYWTVIGVLNDSEKYLDMVDEFEILINEFNYLFTKEDFLQDEYYQEFVKSQAFKEWSLSEKK